MDTVQVDLGKVDVRDLVTVGTELVTVTDLVTVVLVVNTLVDEGQGSIIGFWNGGWQQQIGDPKGSHNNFGSEHLKTAVK